MLSKSERLLIFRFLFSKKSEGYVSIFSWFSIIGISLGVAAIIIVMSVMNGFRIDLTKRIVGINSHLNVYSFDQIINNNDIKLLISNLKKNSYSNYYKSLETNGLVIKENKSNGVLIKGYENYDNIHYIDKSIIKGSAIKNNNQVLIGDALANRMNVSVGDKIKIAIPKTDKTILGNIPRFKTLEIAGIFDFGLYEYDSTLIFLSANLARKLIILENNNYNKVEFYLSNAEDVEILQNEIISSINRLGLEFYTISWKQNNKVLINALKVEKNVMFIILTLIVLVASLNIISGLIIFVKEKNKDIGILKTIGMSNFSIVKIFFSIGISIGLIGSLIGLVLGILFTLNIQLIQSFLETTLDTKLFSEEIYYLSSIPSQISINEVIIVFITSVSISILSTIFPALRSAKINPIQSIRSE